MKFPRLYAILLVMASALTLPSVAAAQEAFTSKAVNVRAGPDRGYPLVVWLPAGSAVYVNGCQSDYRWCDVTAGADRGWVYSRNLQYTYQGQPMTIYGNGPTLSLPIISFILGSYWDNNYRDRSWYGGQQNWNNWRPGIRPPPNYYPQPRPPRPPLGRPDRPRPPFVQPPRSMPPGTVQPPRTPRPPRNQQGGTGEGLPGFVTPGPNSPAAQR